MFREGFKLRGPVRLSDFEATLRSWRETNSGSSRSRPVRDVLFAAAAENKLEALDAHLRKNGYPEGLQADDFCAAISTRRYRSFGRCTFFFDDPQGRAARNIMVFLEKKDSRFSPALLAAAVRYCEKPALREIFSLGYWGIAQEELQETCRILHRDFPKSEASKVAGSLMEKLENPEKAGLVEIPDSRGRRTFVDLSARPEDLSARLAAILRRRLDQGGDSTALLDFGAPEIAAFTCYQRRVFDAINLEKQFQDKVHEAFVEVLRKVQELSGEISSRRSDSSLMGKVFGLFNGKARGAVKAISEDIDRLEAGLPDRIASARRVADEMHRAAGRFERFSAYFNACSSALETVGGQVRAGRLEMDGEALADLSERYEDLSRMAAVSAGARLTARTISDRNREAAVALGRLQAHGLSTVRTTLIQLEEQDRAMGGQGRTADLLNGIQAMAEGGRKVLGGTHTAWDEASKTFMTFIPKGGSEDKIPPLKTWVPT